MGDKSVNLKQADRFADRGAADAKTFGKIDFAQPAPGHEFALPQRGQQLPAHRGALRFLDDLPGDLPEVGCIAFCHSERL